MQIQPRQKQEAVQQDYRDATVGAVLLRPHNAEFRW